MSEWDAELRQHFARILAEQVRRELDRPTLLDFRGPYPPPPRPGDDDPAPWVRSFHRNAKWLADNHGSIEEAAVADALECDWPGLDGEDS